MLVAAAVLLSARRSRLPLPILLVLGGVVLGFFPGSRTCSSRRTSS